MSTRPRTRRPPPAPLACAAEVTDLHVERGGTAILRGVTCTIPAGACTALLGPNGCGKTSFTRCLTGHMFVTRGHVRVLGQTIGATDVRVLRRRVGVVNPTVDAAGAHLAGAVVDADLTAHEAVLTGFFHTVGLYDRPTPRQRAWAEELLDQVGLAGRRRLRFGLLSTGEQRRCLVARALVHTPELLILDEPTAGLDVGGREQVLATIEAILSRPDAPTVLFITHHVEELSPRTAQVLLMRQGRLVAAGPPARVITPGLLTRAFGCRVLVNRVHGRWWLRVLPTPWPRLGSPP